MKKWCKDCKFKSKKFQFDCDKMKANRNLKADFENLIAGSRELIPGYPHLCFIRNRNEDCSDFTPTLWARIKNILRRK